MATICDSGLRFEREFLKIQFRNTERAGIFQWRVRVGIELRIRNTGSFQNHPQNGKLKAYFNSRAACVDCRTTSRVEILISRP